MGIDTDSIIKSIMEIRSCLQRAYKESTGESRVHINNAMGVLDNLKYSIATYGCGDDLPCDTCEWSPDEERKASQTYVDSLVKQLRDLIDRRVSETNSTIKEVKRVQDGLSNRIYKLEAREECHGRC